MKTKSITRETLDEGMSVVHYHRSCKSVTFNKFLSLKLKKMNMEYVLIGSCNGKHYFSFYEKNPNIDYGEKISFIRSGGTGCSAVVYSDALVKRLFNLFHIIDFDCCYYFDISVDSEPIIGCDYSLEIKKVRKRGDYLLSNHTENSTIPFVATKQEPKISEATDEQLVKELGKRGFTGELSKHFDLLAPPYKILDF